MKLFTDKKRAVHLGPYPLERLPRFEDPTAIPPGAGVALPPRRAEVGAPGPRNAGHAYQRYLDLFDSQREGEVAPLAPIPQDPIQISENLKAGLYFLDADMAGCGLIPDLAWTGEPRAHRYAVVTLIAFSR